MPPHKEGPLALVEAGFWQAASLRRVLTGPGVMSYLACCGGLGVKGSSWSPPLLTTP